MEAKDQRVMESEYRYNRSFRNYVDRYCKEHGCDKRRQGQGNPGRKGREIFGKIYKGF